jgi:uncharacterized protein (DUF1778 family)
MPDEAKTERFEARMTESVYALLRNAASLQGRSLSDFVVDSAREVAEKVVAENEVIKLSVANQERFAACLFVPTPMAPAMEQAKQRHQDWVEVVPPPM